MERARKWAYPALAVLCVAVTLGFFVLLFLSPTTPKDLGSYAYLAITSPGGEEYIYQKGDEVLQGAAAAFAAATPAAQQPDGLREALFLTVEWIQSGRATTWRLYFLPSTASGYLVDERGHAFRLHETGLLFFLHTDFIAPLLVGEEPPAVWLGEAEVPFSICRWAHTVSTAEGGTETITSGEYTNNAAGSLPVLGDAFAPTFAVAPQRATYTVYRGAEQVLVSDAPPALSSLPAGEYQVVLVAEWQAGYTTTRAGYSFSFGRVQ